MVTFSIPHDAIAGYTLKMNANTAITDLGAGKEQRRANWARYLLLCTRCTWLLLLTYYLLLFIF